MKYKDNWSRLENFDIYHAFKKDIIDQEEAIITDVLKSMGTQCGQILEIGIGDGNLTQRLVNIMKFKSYEGIDVSDKAIKKARSVLKNKNISLSKKDANKFETKKTYDLILSLNSWYGIKTGKIRGYLDMLNDKGVMIISVNAATNLKNDELSTAKKIQDYLENENIPYTIRKDKILIEDTKAKNKYFSKVNIEHEKSEITQVTFIL